jgi:hypothetical protein
MPLQGDAIWLPGQGMTSITERQVADAVAEYDADLMLGQRRDTGDWCVFMPGNRNSEGQPFPVFTFGQELPHPDTVKNVLYQHDIRRNGRELMDQLDRIYDDEQDKIKDKAQEGIEMLAEAIDSNMRDQGTHPYPRVYMSGRGKRNGKQRVRSGD